MLAIKNKIETLCEIMNKTSDEFDTIFIDLAKRDSIITQSFTDISDKIDYLILINNGDTEPVKH